MSKKKTHEEYVAELAIKNPTVEVVEKYIDSKTNIMHHCLKHDIYWSTAPSRVLNGAGCEYCKKEKFRSTRTKSNDEYIEQVKNISPHIIVMEPYINARTKILHKCTVHNVEWLAYPDGILKGCGCSICGNKKNGDKKRKSQEQYINEVAEINPNITVIGTYTNANTPILHKCLLDNYEWNAIPSQILSGGGCPKCAGNIRRTQEEYVSEVKKNNPNIKVIGRYINANTPILHKCFIHNVEWKTSPVSILQGCGCPECGKNKIGDSNRKSHEQYIKELKEVNSNISVIGTYTGANTPTLHKCLIDGYEWYITPAHALSGDGCPQCNESKGERKVRQWLKKHNIMFEYQKTFDDCRDIKPLPFDFYLPEYNLCIEYDGEQHFRPIEYFNDQEGFEYTIKHDKIKNNYCKNNNITLLRIPYFKNVEEELNNFLFI